LKKLGQPRKCIDLNVSTVLGKPLKCIDHRVDIQAEMRQIRTPQVGIHTLLGLKIGTFSRVCIVLIWVVLFSIFFVSPPPLPSVFYRPTWGIWEGTKKSGKIEFSHARLNTNKI